MTSASETAREAVDLLLKTLGVTKVIWVDDYFGRPIGIDDLQRAQLKLTPAELAVVMPEMEKIADDVDIRKEQFRVSWNQLSPSDAENRSKLILGVANNPGEENDEVAASNLREIVGSNRLEALSPKAWDTREPQLLADGALGKVLVLFDYDLSQAGETTTAGLTRLRSTLSRDPHGRFVVGLLTNTVDSKSQHRRWEEMAKEAEVPRDKFLVLAKECLRENHIGFARMLKLVAEEPDWVMLKDRAKCIIGYVAARAAASVNELSVFDLDEVIFRGSYNEGMWEPDMLFRLHALFQRRELRAAAMGDPDLTRVVERLRSVSRIPTETTEQPESTGWELQRLDMYEPPQYLNSLLLPVEVGDIFQNTEGAGGKSYLLLGQPCDLSVRSDGKREPELSDALLVEIAPSTKVKKYAEHLPYYGTDPTQNYFAMLKRTVVVDPWMLDLCAFNQDGVSRMAVGVDCPLGLTPAWRMRYGLLHERAEKLVRKYNTIADKMPSKAIANQVRNAIAANFRVRASNGTIFRGDVKLMQGDQGVAFNCVRIGRLSRPRALALSLQYAAHFSRPAFDRFDNDSDGSEGQL